MTRGIIDPVFQYQLVRDIEYILFQGEAACDPRQNLTVVVKAFVPGFQKNYVFFFQEESEYL
jgi:hypothetical protein